MSMKGDMLSGRKRPNLLLRTVLSVALRFPQQDRFEPDLFVDEDSDLTEYGLVGAKVLLLRGPRRAPIGLLLADGSLLCGDLLENRKAPKLGSIMDDVPFARASVERLNALRGWNGLSGSWEAFPVAGSQHRSTLTGLCSRCRIPVLRPSRLPSPPGSHCS